MTNPLPPSDPQAPALPGGEVAAYRWRAFGSKSWVYDPTPEWIEDHKHEIELEALYTTPSSGPTSIPVERLYSEAEISAAVQKTIQGMMDRGEIAPGLTFPPVDGGKRDIIARIINPIAFTALERSYIVPEPEEFMDMKIAREKADKILAACSLTTVSVPAAQAGGVWQGIETAPKDKDAMFLVCAVGDERAPFVVNAGILWQARKSNTPSHLGLSHLTHWMPLPSPPAPMGDR